MKRIKLTPKQEELLGQLNSVLDEMKNEGMKIVFDTKEYSLAAINTKEVKELQDGYMPDENAVDIEDAAQWNNVHRDIIFDYDSYYGDLHAVFK